ncbi:MAG: ion transporter [Winogradskyella sp.]|uniref:ion transporter n=1 Tax=Winogradskyella sp. TaxID=1883156 RepID=UPI000F40AE98|nr:ion transporter [Winogradskyella sp.]RNC79805.1 MAG: ion transporter [Winogradskyella sp.]
MEKTNKHTWRSKLHEIIYEADTPTGKVFDVVLLILIILSIILVMLESVCLNGCSPESFGVNPDSYLSDAIRLLTKDFFYFSEWVVTILFSIEYIARIITVKKPTKYIFSFYGIIDFLSTIPMYLSFIVVGSQSLVALRALRLMRVFRILKLTRYIGASTNFARALKASRAKIAVFLSFVVILCIILGTVMYLVESEESGFTSIPRSVYWAIVTLTTVGYGDIAPITPLGQFIASIIMIMGYGIIAVPTGIVSSEMTKVNKHEVQTNTQSCSNCLAANHRDDAKYCHNCGNTLYD